MMILEHFAAHGISLSLECYPAENPTGKGLVFYYGGGWIEDNRHRFTRFAKDLAQMGITVFLPQYRVYRLHQTPPAVAIRDVAAGLSFVQQLYPKYGISPELLSFGGSSAGAHLILSTILLAPFCHHIKFPPQKIVLFNPVCCPHSLKDWLEKTYSLCFDFTGLCPLCDIWDSVYLPKILAMHGTLDEIAPFEDLERFTKKYQELGGKCRILSYPGRGHGFHHPEVSEKDYQDTLHAIVKFL